MVNRFEQLFFPGFCLLCGAASHRPSDICAPCQQDLPILGPHCSSCGLPLTAQAASQCGQCLKKPPAFQRLIAPWRYQDSVARLISQFKYQRQHSYGKVLADLLAEQLTEAYQDQALPELLVATPMHWLRRLKRGFNHSEQLASQLSQQLRIPVYRGVHRVRHSKTQQSLNADQRRHNLKSAFKAHHSLDGQRIAVIDDVVTTGATANELSRTLLAAGAAQVHIWCLARTPK